jgi:NAD(P)-dependent dehydrogenase (short-subunit alcohol dehydrogenase family)
MTTQTEQGKIDTNKPVVAVFGATGHTGRFVIAELLRRGMTPIAIGRSAKTLSAANFPENEVYRRQATVDDEASLDRALHGALAVINCAGPFLDTADAVANAALRAGIHYVDVCAEQVSASQTLEKFDAPARQAGVAVVPAMAFYGGYTDLMVTALVEGWGAVDSIEILMGIDSWHPTQGTRNTIARKAVGNLVISGGRLTPMSDSQEPKRWDIPGPLGEQAVVEVPFSEAILISRHVKTRELHNYLPHIAVSEVLNSETPAPKATDALGRSAQQFVVEVIVKRGGEERRAISRGRDSYAVTAPLACEAVERLLRGQFRSAGTHAPGEIFDARAFLGSLGHDYSFEIRS